MPAKRRGLPTWVFILAGALVFTVYFVFKHFGPLLLEKAVKGSPAELITKTMDPTKVSPRITRRTGPIDPELFKVDNLGSSKDTLALRYRLSGPRATATVRLWMARQAHNTWRIVKGDTVFSAPAAATLPKP